MPVQKHIVWVLLVSQGHQRMKGWENRDFLLVLWWWFDRQYLWCVGSICKRTTVSTLLWESLNPQWQLWLTWHDYHQHQTWCSLHEAVLQNAEGLCCYFQHYPKYLVQAMWNQTIKIKLAMFEQQTFCVIPASSMTSKIASMMWSPSWLPFMTWNASNCQAISSHPFSSWVQKWVVTTIKAVKFGSLQISDVNDIHPKELSISMISMQATLDFQVCKATYF